MKVSLTRIAMGITEAGIPAYVAQTGGGCATIYVGAERTTDDGDIHYDFSVGPGSYDWHGTDHEAWTEDLCSGLDDQGEDQTYLVDYFAARTEREIVDAVISSYRSWQASLTADQAEALGFDPGMRDR